MATGKQKSRKTVLFLGAALILLSSAPVFSFYLNGAGDLDFHLARVEAMRYALRAGQFPVRVSGYWCDGYGYASSVLYGELFLYVPAVLRLIGFSPQSAYKIYLLGVNIATFAIAYYCLYRICKERLSAFMGTAVYMLAPHRLTALHLRAAVGEYTAMAFLPLVVYGLYLIYTEETDTRHKKGWIYLALGFSGLIQCHVISTFIVAIFTFLVCLLKIRATLRKERLLQFVKAVGCTVLWNLWFLLPFLDYMRFDYRMSGVSAHGRGRFASHAAFLSQMISFFPHGEGASIVTAEIWDADGGMEMSYTLGGGMMLAIVLYAVYRIYRGRQEKDGDAVIGKMAGMLCGLCLLSLFMSTTWFPWDFLQQRSDFIAWITGSIQFPWRFMTISSVTGAFLTAFFLYGLRRTAKKEFLYGAVFSIGFLSLLSANYFLQDYEMKSRVRYVTENEVSSWALGVGEYLPATINEWTFRHEQLNLGEDLSVENYERGQGTVTLSCENVGNAETFVDVPILYYKGYQAKDAETGGLLTVAAADSGRVRVILPEGYRGTFTVRFVSPWYWRVCEGVSLVSVVIFLIWRYYVRKDERLI